VLSVLCQLARRVRRGTGRSTITATRHSAERRTVQFSKRFKCKCVFKILPISHFFNWRHLVSVCLTCLPLSWSSSGTCSPQQSCGSTACGWLCFSPTEQECCQFCRFSFMVSVNHFSQTVITLYSVFSMTSRWQSCTALYVVIKNSSSALSPQRVLHNRIHQCYNQRWLSSGFSSSSAQWCVSWSGQVKVRLH